MHTIHLRTDGNHIEVGVFLEEETALQAGMDRQHFGFGLEEVDIRFLDDLEQGRIRIRRPTRIAVSVRHLVASHGERLLYRPFEMMLGDAWRPR